MYAAGYGTALEATRLSSVELGGMGVNRPQPYG